MPGRKRKQTTKQGPAAAVVQAPGLPAPEIVKRVNRIQSSVNRLEATSHLQHITAEGLQWLSATTAPFAYMEGGGKLPVRIPDPSGGRTAGAVLSGTFSHAIPATHTVASIELSVNSDDSNLVRVCTGTGTGVDFSAGAAQADGQWTKVKADMAATKPCRIAGGALRVKISGSEHPTGSLRAVETNVTPLDSAGGYHTYDEVIAGATRVGESFSCDTGIMSRKLFELDFEILPLLKSGAATLTRDRLIILGQGLTPADTIEVDYVLFVEYRTVLSSVVRASPSPVDFHWILLQVIANDQSDIDHTANSLESLIKRVVEFSQTPVAKRAAKYALKAGTGALSGAGAGPAGAVTGAATAVGPLLLDDLVRLLPK